MRSATVRRTSFRPRSTSSVVIESTFGPRKYGVTWSRASAESRPETKSAEQRILAVPATRQLSGSLGGKPGWASSPVVRATNATPTRAMSRTKVAGAENDLIVIENLGWPPQSCLTMCLGASPRNVPRGQTRFLRNWGLTRVRPQLHRQTEADPLIPLVLAIPVHRA